jgi:hypothetical protein
MFDALAHEATIAIAFSICQLETNAALDDTRSIVRIEIM